ncbi:hypothetical protein CDO52_25915 [Nocardiopsis gilva YIM 90087]|uniref:Uncharacterized protein n=2 Tax=Nocardiopsis gilva TaxID=280236 RepID=A0A223SC90_9ACTN|nr:hypothetical protein CDO52_25915 [Nocardiopsis gilva YIM 90087]
MLLVAGFAAMGTGVSFAGSDPVTSGDGAVRSDSQVLGDQAPGLAATDETTSEATSVDEPTPTTENTQVKGATPVEGAAPEGGVASEQGTGSAPAPPQSRPVGPLGELASAFGLELGL